MGSGLSFGRLLLHRMSTLTSLPARPTDSLVLTLVSSPSVLSSLLSRSRLLLILSAKQREAAGEDVNMDEDVEEEDPVPELTRAHFEEAMKSARKSVSDVEIRRYEAFAQSMKNSGGSSFFRFPSAGEVGENDTFGEAGNDDSLYD